MRIWHRTTVAGLVSVLAGAALLSQPAAAQGGKAPIKVSLNHWQNVGLTKNPNFPNYFTWVNGNLNSQHNSYAEQDTVPYRFVLQNLKGGQTYKLMFEYETTKAQGGVARHATDYLRTYDASEGGGKWVPQGGSDPNPCEWLTEGPNGGPPTCAGPVDQTLDIPADPCVDLAGVSQPAGKFSFWNVALGSPAIVANTSTNANPYIVTSSGGAVLNCGAITNATGTTYTAITVQFTVAGNSGTTQAVVMAIGGHLSSFTDWGVDLSSGSISGSPWHFRFSLLQNGTKPLADGNRDRSINIFKISAITLLKECTGSAAGGPFNFDITIDGDVIEKSLSCGETYSRRLVQGAEFTFVETDLPQDWTLVTVLCSSQRGTTFTYIGTPVNGAVFDPLPHDKIICTFTNNFGGGGGGGGSKRRFMTGGGSVLDVSQSINRVTHGFHLLCPTGNRPPAKSNNLQVNWIDSADLFNPKEYHFHLDGSTLEVLACDGAGTTSPKTDWRHFKGQGFGSLNGQLGAFAEWEFVDNAEPGRLNDTLILSITAPNGNLLIPPTALINSGNHQAH